jgi:hypothetical protein
MKTEIEKPIITQEKFPWGILRFAFLLIIIMAMLIAYSFHEKELKVLGLEIKQNNMASFFTPLNDVVAFKGIKFVWNTTTEVDTSKQRILMFGDSMSGYLRLRLNDYCEKNDHTMYSVVWNSGNTVWFADYDTIGHFVRKFEPTYILMVLGGNELFLPKPEYRQKYIDIIINKFGDIPFIWVGPPNWKEDTGINDLILRSVGRKRFFPSLNLSYKRLADGAHPDRESAYNWMDSIAVFMMTKAKHPIIMEFPDKPAAKYPPTTMLAPLRANRESKELSVDPEPGEIIIE